MTSSSRVEGKTKIVSSLPQCARVFSKDDITAGDGKKHDVMEEKGELSTKTTSNVFRLLQSCGVPVAFYAQDSKRSFIAPLCTMIALEVVVRRQAHGSYLKRYPETTAGHRFDPPLVELYLKTKNREWRDRKLLCDDPLVKMESMGQYNLAHLQQPNDPSQTVFESIPLLDGTPDELEGLVEIAVRAFSILERAWMITAGYVLADIKIEGGLDGNGVLRIADVADNDSWRLLDADGNYLDKQNYRDGTKTLEEVRADYVRVAHATDTFSKLEGRFSLETAYQKGF